MLHLDLPASRSITLLVSVCVFLASRPGTSGSSHEPKHAFPEMLRGDWFSWEDGQGHRSMIDESEYEQRGAPVTWRSLAPDVLDYIFEVGSCRFCSRFLVRSWNIIERFDGPCNFRQTSRVVRSAEPEQAVQPASATSGSRTSLSADIFSADRNVSPHDVKASNTQKRVNREYIEKEVSKMLPKHPRSFTRHNNSTKKPKILSSFHTMNHNFKGQKRHVQSESVSNQNFGSVEASHRKVGRLSTRAAVSKIIRPSAKMIEIEVVKSGYKYLSIDKLCSFLNDVVSGHDSPRMYFQNVSRNSAQLQRISKMLDDKDEMKKKLNVFHPPKDPVSINANSSRNGEMEPLERRANRDNLAPKMKIGQEYQKIISSERTGTADGGHGVLMHRRNPVPVTCLAFLRGHYHMAWRDTHSSSALCIHPRAELTSCQAAGERMTADGEQMTVVYRRCPGVSQSYDAEVSYSCLGSWHVGTRHYLAVASLQQGNEEERYRCFLHDLTEPRLVIGASVRPGCGDLSAPDASPVLMELTPVVPSVPPSCTFPSEYSGTWQSTGRGEPRVHINSTHMVTSLYRGPREVQVVHVCLQNRGKRYLLAAVPDNGCNVEYVCWEMLPRHHNIVRYRHSRHSNIASFEACDHRSFGSGRHWKYDALIIDPPDPVACPVRGRFSVVQEGSMPFMPRVLGGVTVSPLDKYSCKHRAPVWSVCDSRGYGSNTIVLDLDECTDLDPWGKPLVVKEVPDYEMLCAGYWQENLRSYLVTYSASDPVSRYRCWVYRRISLEEVRLSAAVGSACGLHQTHLSSWYNESAQVALTLKLEERLHDQCPMEFDLGRDPWASDQRLRSLPVVFTFTNNSSYQNDFCASYLLLVIATSTVLLFF